jgi:hypothetical protein
MLDTLHTHPSTAAQREVAWCQCKAGFVSTDGGKHRYDTSAIGTFFCTLPDLTMSTGWTGPDRTVTGSNDDHGVLVLHKHSHHKSGSTVVHRAYDYTLAGTKRHCGSSWLREMQGIELQVLPVDEWCVPAAPCCYTARTKSREP